MIRANYLIYAQFAIPGERQNRVLEHTELVGQHRVPEYRGLAVGTDEEPRSRRDLWVRIYTTDRPPNALTHNQTQKMDMMAVTRALLPA